jgi:5-dehydro-2-deoxygluconokinase
MKQSYDLISVGRVSMDLFAEEIGARFEEITAFETGVGGSPTNIAIGSSRLGLKSALLTAVGDDEVGKFVRHYLTAAGVETQFIPTISGKKTGMAVVGVQPPDKFPLVFYREDPADIYLTVGDAERLPIEKTKALMLTGTGLSRGTCRDAMLFAAEEARRFAATTFLDLDLRPDQWSHPKSFGLNMRAILPLVDVLIGTEEEYYAALADDPTPVMHGHSVPEARQAELEHLITDLTDSANRAKTHIVKRGASGATIFKPGQMPIDVAGFPVEILNTVGAGDAFASGLLYGAVNGWEWARAVRMANACGALVVTRHGCGTAMPTLQEAESFIQQRGGF